MRAIKQRNQSYLEQYWLRKWKQHKQPTNIMINITTMIKDNYISAINIDDNDNDDEYVIINYK